MSDVNPFTVALALFLPVALYILVRAALPVWRAADWMGRYAMLVMGGAVLWSLIQMSPALR